MWKALYDSPLWLPILPSSMAALVLVAIARRGFGAARSLHVFAAGFALLAAADAWLGGPLSPLPSGAWTTASAVFFVIAGDFRYFLAARLGRIPLRRALLRALVVSFVVPVASQLCVRVPFPQASERVLFLSYEIGFLLLIAAEYRQRATRGANDAAACSLLVFETVQYTLWAAADLLLLAEVEAGYALRIVPNVLYYTAFVPFAVWALRSRREIFRHAGRD